MQHTATNCNTHCNTHAISDMAYSTQNATHRNTLQHTATHCNTLQHTATHYNTLQHTATDCNTLQHTHKSVTCWSAWPIQPKTPQTRRSSSANSPPQVQNFDWVRTLYENCSHIDIKIGRHSSSANSPPQVKTFEWLIVNAGLTKR